MKFTPYVTVGFSAGYGGEFSTSISMACANLSEASAQEVRDELSKLVERFDDFRRQHPPRPKGPNVVELLEERAKQRAPAPTPSGTPGTAERTIG